MADRREDLDMLAKQGIAPKKPAGLPPGVTSESFGRKTYLDVGAPASGEWDSGPSASRASGDSLEGPKGNLTGSALANMIDKSRQRVVDKHDQDVASAIARVGRKYYGQK